jgi:hypothetical protein
VVFRPEASASIGNLLEIQMLALLPHLLVHQLWEKSLAICISSSPSGNLIHPKI